MSWYCKRCGVTGLGGTGNIDCACGPAAIIAVNNQAGWTLERKLDEGRLAGMRLLEATSDHVDGKLHVQVCLERDALKKQLVEACRVQAQASDAYTAILRTGYEHLTNEAETLRSDNTQLLAENARLRRALEKKR